ncbi:MAG: cytochrome C [Bacteroidetes bacterium]|nr:cytochrome C [Bacteroidota bacterium]
MKKILISILAIVVIAIICGLIYVKYFLPNVGAPEDITLNTSMEHIQHGAYLANHVTVCMDCHSTRDWTKFSGPLIPGTLGKGGAYFGHEASFPGNFYSKNITPAGIKDWTNGEIFRTITTGVNKKGEALFPVMPYANYGKMDREDVMDIIAYIRSLAPIENAVPVRSIDFPMNFIVNTIPKKATFTKRPPASDSISYGAYLTNAASCIDCHTPFEKGKLVMELSFSGGREFKMPNGLLKSANITPDQNTGIGNWSENDFVSRFKSYSNPANVREMTPKEINTVMPWTMYSGMDSSDLRSIYQYLKTLKPISHKIDHFTYQ